MLLILYTAKNYDAVMINAADALDAARKSKILRYELHHEYAKQNVLLALSIEINNQAKLGKRELTWRITAIGHEKCAHPDFNINVAWQTINTALDTHHYEYDYRIEWNERDRGQIDDVAYTIRWSRARWGAWLRSYTSYACPIQ